METEERILRDLVASIGQKVTRTEAADYVNAHSSLFQKSLEIIWSKKGTREFKHGILNILDLMDPVLARMSVKLALQDSDPSVRLEALHVAYRGKIESLSQCFVEVLEDCNRVFEERKWALHILASVDPKRYGSLIRTVARNCNEDVMLRVEALYAMTIDPDELDIGLLCASLGDPDARIRRAGAWALCRIASPDSVVSLLAALEDTDDEVRDWSIRALRAINSPRALQGLADAMKRAAPAEQARLIRLVLENRSEVLLRMIAQLLESTDASVRRMAAWALSVTPYPPAEGKLVSLLDDSDSQVRDYARLALNRLTSNPDEMS
ncbi:MAG: HEAT repeat domain-containing protein [Candidatus Thorarchaeota archaeon]